MRCPARHLFTAVSFATVLAVTAACSSSSGSTSSAADGTSASSGASASSGSPVRIGMIGGTIDNPYFTQMEAGAKAAAAKYGVSLTWNAPATATDTAGQANMLNTMIDAGDNCLAFDPLSTLNLVAPMARATQQGIPMIQLSVPPAAAVDKARGITITSFVGPNNVAGGEAAGNLMVKLLPAGSDVAIIGGVAGVQGTNDRPNGFRAAVKGKLNVTQFTYVAATDQATGLSTAAEMIRRNPNLKGIFTIGGLQALGAQTAVNNAGKSSDIKVVGIDGILPQLQAIEAGTMAGGVSLLPYAMGYQGVEACMAAHAGKTLPARATLPPLTITKDNAASAVANYPAPPTGFVIPDPFASLAAQLANK